MESSSKKIRRILDENIYLLRLFNIEFKDNLDLILDVASNPNGELKQDNLTLCLKKSYETVCDGSVDYVTLP